jgi:bifunctional non-homologous end joining protein LigD
MQAEANRSVFRERAYAMKKHHATRLHYDLRLEWNGVLLSWALPEGPSCRAGVIRKAIEMEDHCRANLLFEGVHETGPIMLWDRGTWEPHSEFEDIESCLGKGVLRFTLHGEKLKGGWMLKRTSDARNTSRPVWILCKEADSFAGNHMFTEKEWQNSIITRRTMEDIVRGWTIRKDRHEGQAELFD